MAEGDVPPRVAPRRIETRSVPKDALIAIAREIPQHDAIALAQLLTRQVGIGSAGAAHVRDGRLPADRLLRGIGDQRAIGTQRLERLREKRAGVDETAHRVARGIVAADDEQRDVGDAFDRRQIAHRFAVDHPRKQVAARRLRALGFEQRIERGKHSRHFHREMGAALIALIRTDVAREIGPVLELAAVFPRKIEKDGDHADRQLDRHAIDPVEGLADG